MTQISLVPVRELTKAICVPAMPGRPPVSLADDFVGELVGEFADLGVGGRAAINLADDGWRSGLRTSNSQAWMATSAADSVRLPKATMLALTGGSVQAALLAVRPGTVGTCCG